MNGQDWGSAVKRSRSPKSARGAAKVTAPRLLRMESLESRCLLDAGPLITEFLAKNQHGLKDGDGKISDWLEIYNPTATDMNLQGWCLTTSPTNLAMWPFPSFTVHANEYKVVFATGEATNNYVDAGGNLHTNFKISASGSYLALVRPDGTVAHAYAPQYPPQTADISYGLQNTSLQQVTLVSPSDDVAYHVPTAGDDPTAWTQPGFVENSSWVSTVATGAAGLGITEISTGTVPYVEIENLASQTIDTSGWSVLINNPSGGINGVNASAWDLSTVSGHQMAAGQVLYKTGAANDNYWGSAITWAATGSGWAMILDNTGHVQDFVPWGYTVAQIQSLSINFGGFSSITVGSQWNGDGAAAGTSGGTVTGFTAFNDQIRGPGTNVNTTNYAASGSPDGAATSGLLMDVASGNSTTATLSVTANGVSFENAANPPASGTPAYNAFNSYVDFTNNASGTSLGLTGGAQYTHTVSGLDTTHTTTYNFTGTVVRGNSGYTRRWTLVTLVGADSATPASSNGAGIYAVSLTQVAIWSGDNSQSSQGFIVGWTNIDPGSDGSFSVVESQYTGVIPTSVDAGGLANDTKAYALTGIELQSNVPAQTMYLQRTGMADTNTASDFVRVVAGSKGAKNPSLTVPLGSQDTCSMGIGFSTNKPSYATLIQTNVASAMLGVNPSLWTRETFQANGTSYATLKLRMKYDDGFVAYLNGTEIARRNAPTSLSYNSSATTTHPDAQAATFEDIDVTSFIGALVPGTNVLAIRGLNLIASDGDFLIDPELDATTNAGNLQYMTTPTPRAANAAGIASLGPQIRNVTDNMPSPTDSQNVAITAAVTPFLHAVGSVQLHYRVDYGTEVAIAMLDNGSNGDALAGDGVYTAVIPASASGPGQMLRWYVTASDTSALTTRAPAYLSATNSPQYYGTVIADSVVSDLAVYRWFTANPSAARTRTGTRASIFYLGQFYDNIFVRYRGKNYTAGYRFEFNSSFPFYYAGGQDPVGEFNLNYQTADPTFVRTPLSFDTFRDAGVASCLSFVVHLQRNNAFETTADYVEQVDNEFVSNHDLNSSGALYKHQAYDDPQMTNISAFDRQSPKGVTDTSDLQAFLNGIHLTGTPQLNYLFDHVNIAAFLDYQAANILVGDNDDVQKNYCLYGDTSGTGEWWFLPWDKDLTFGLNWGITDYAAKDPQAHPFFGDSNHWKVDSTSSYNFLIDALLDIPEIKQMYLRRLRTLMDQLLQPASTPYLQRYYETQIDQYYTQLSSDPLVLAQLGGSATLQSRLNDIKNKYLGDLGPNGWGRRTHLFVQHLVGSGYADCAGIPAAQVGSPAITFGTIDYNPVSHNQDEEYIELHNSNSVAVDCSGWTLSGAINYALKPGTVIPAGMSIYLTPNALAFRARTTGPSGNKGLLVQGNYSGHLAALGGTLVLKDASGSQVSTTTYAGNASTVQRNLRITEVNYEPIAPPTGSSYSATDFEFIELLNTSSTTTVDLTGVHFTPDTSNNSSITFSFTGSAVTSLPPSRYVVVAKNPTALATRYNMTGVLVVGPYTGSLAEGGDTIRLYDAVNEKINEIHYSNSDPWPGRADGKGATLEIISLLGNDNDPTNWRSSNEYNGTPGYAGIDLPDDNVVINEVLTHTDPPLYDSIELYNTTASSINVGGWYLSDNSKNYMKFRIPDGTVLGGYQYLVYSGKDFDIVEYAAATEGVGGVASVEDSGATLHITGNGWKRIAMPDTATAGTVNANTILEFDFSSPVEGMMQGIGFDGSGGNGDDAKDSDHTFQLYGTGTTFGITATPAYTYNSSSPWQHYVIRLGDYAQFSQGAMTCLFFANDNDGENPNTPAQVYFRNVKIYQQGQSSTAIDFNRYFGLNGAKGDDVWLMRADSNGNLTRFIDHVDFGAAVNGESFGRWPNGSGDLYPMSGRTLGAANNGPRIGPALTGNGWAVISEVMYAPPDPGNGIDPQDLEYIEIYNPTTSSIDLTNWHLDKGVQFDFAAGTILPALGTLVVIPFDPADPLNAIRLAAFRSGYGISSSVTLVGGFKGHLDNAGEKIQLQRPDTPAPTDPTYYPDLTEDEVDYGVTSPWPTTNTGQSLTRQAANTWGEDAASWIAAAPTPGSFVANDQPPTEIALLPASVPENSPNGNLVGTLSTTDPNVGDTFTYSLLDNAGGRFTISGNQVLVANGLLLDYEAASTETIRLRSTDHAGLWVERTLTISVTNVNEAPTDLLLSPATVPENSSANMLVGYLATNDPDAGDTFTYALVNSAGSRIVLAGNQVLVAAGAGLDYETNPTFTIRVRTTDSGGLWLEKDLVIQLSNVNEPPTANAGGPYTGGIGFAVQLDASLSIDPDTAHGDTLAYAWDLNNDGLYEFNATTAAATVPYSAIASLGEGTHALQVRVTDSGGLTNTATATLTILGGTITLTPDQASVRIAADAANPGNALVFLGSPTLTPGYSVVLADLALWHIIGGAEDDQVTVDFTSGSPLPTGGMTVDGGGHVTGDSLSIIGTSGNDQVQTACTAASTTVIVNSQPGITCTNLDSLGYNLGSGQDSLSTVVAASQALPLTSLSSGIAMTVDGGGTVDLLGNTGVVRGLVVINGKFTDGTLVSDSLAIQSGSVGATLGGTQGLTKTGSGTAWLSGTNRYTGVTVVEAGTLVIANPGSLPDGGGLTIGSDTNKYFSGQTVVASTVPARASSPLPSADAANRATSGEDMGSTLKASTTAHAFAVRAIFPRPTMTSLLACPLVPAAKIAVRGRQAAEISVANVHDRALLSESLTARVGNLTEYLGILSARAKMRESSAGDRRGAVVDQLLMRMQ
jgi:autotransporter-associated beta strand protein